MCDLVGMASADSITAALVLGSDLTNWGFLPDRSVQGMVNSLVRFCLNVGMQTVHLCTSCVYSEMQLDVMPLGAIQQRCFRVLDDTGSLFTHLHT